MWDHTPLELFFLGGFAMWPLLGMSILDVALILDRLIVHAFHRSKYRRFMTWLRARQTRVSPRELRDEVRAWNTPLARVTEAYLDALDDTSESRHQVVGMVASGQISNLESRMPLLASLVQLAPMLGLLGTVTGLVSAFHEIEIQVGAVKPADLAGGIWEALITTVFGLVIAIPCGFFYQIFDATNSRLAQEMEWLVVHLDQTLGKQAAEGSIESPTPGERHGRVHV